MLWKNKISSAAIMIPIGVVTIQPTVKTQIPILKAQLTTFAATLIICNGQANIAEAQPSKSIIPLKSGKMPVRWSEKIIPARPTNERSVVKQQTLLNLKNALLIETGTIGFGSSSCI